MAKRAKFVVEPSEESREMVFKLLSQAPEPLTAKQVAAGLTGPFKLNDKQLTLVLDQFLNANALQEFPPLRGKALRYWDRGIEELAERVLLIKLAAKGPMKLPELKKLVVKEAKGLTDSQFETAFRHHQTAGQIFEHPPASSRIKTTQWAVRLPVADDYLKSVASELSKIVSKLAAVGVPMAVLREAGIRMLEVAGLDVGSVPCASTEASQTRPVEPVDLMSLMCRVEPRAASGALVTTPELRRAANLPKDEFDRAVLQCARSGQLVLHRHDFPARLSESERGELVTDGAGTFFVGVGIRQTVIPALS